MQQDNSRSEPCSLSSRWPGTLMAIDLDGWITGIEIHSAGFGDEDLQRIGGLRSLQSITLSSSCVTNSGLRQLQEHKNLREVSVGPGNSGITDAGLKTLGQALPECQVARVAPPKSLPL